MIGGSMARKPIVWLLLLVVLSFVLLAYPLYVIRPFRHQDPDELALALAVLRFRPFVQIALAIAALACLVLAWPKSRGLLRKAGASVCAVLVVLFGILSWVNVYELMFHPLDRAEFSPASQTKLDGDEQVIAVEMGHAARAYPIRVMSYHHIVNDTLGGVPIAATY
jgi:thiol:disulfide interchange protein